MPGAPTLARPWTLERWAALSEDCPGELVDGRLVDEEVPTRLHEACVAWLLFELTMWTRAHGARVYGSELKLAIDDDRGRKPDLCLFFADTPRSPPDASVQRHPPDLVVEVVSAEPSDARRDRILKPDDYARAGVRFYWLVDPQLRSFESWQLEASGRHVRTSSATEGLLRPSELEGLTLDLDALWADLDREG